MFSYDGRGKGALWGLFYEGTNPSYEGPTLIEFNFSFPLATFQVFNSHIWLVATILDRADYFGHFHHHGNFYCIALVE